MSLATNISDLALRVATQFKSTQTLINGNQANLSDLNTTAKTNLVAAINEVYSAIASAGASIDDDETSTLSVWSSSKTSVQIANAVADLVSSSPAALDTLKELADALGNDPNFATTITTQLNQRVRFDATQTLTTAEKNTARANIGAGTSSLVIGTTAGTAADAAATASSLASKEAKIQDGTTAQYIRGNKTLATLDKAAVGLPLVNNTSDADKPISTAVSTALGGKSNVGHTHTAEEISNATSIGRSVMKAGTAAAARTAIGAGTGSSNLTIGTTAGTAADAAAVGNTNTDFVAIFESGLV